MPPRLQDDEVNATKAKLEELAGAFLCRGHVTPVIHHMMHCSVCGLLSPDLSSFKIDCSRMGCFYLLQCLSFCSRIGLSPSASSRCCCHGASHHQPTGLQPKPTVDVPAGGQFLGRFTAFTSKSISGLLLLGMPSDPCNHFGVQCPTAQTNAQVVAFLQSMMLN